MIIAACPPLAAAEAARRAGQGRWPVWLASPGDGDVGLEREYVGCEPVAVVRGSSLDTLDELAETWRAQRAAWRAGPGAPIGFGFFGYDLGRRFERLREVARPDAAWPEVEFRFYDALWVRAGADGRAEIWAQNAAAARRLIGRLGVAPAGEPRAGTIGPLVPVDPDEQHLAGVRRILEYLRAGDVYQVNLARRLCAGGVDGAAAWALMARLQDEAPAPHAIWLGGEDGAALVGNSPERFLRVHADGRVETRPIKGTRGLARGAAAELAGDPKDLAEHTMIVDLERNDLGRVCVTGSVHVEGFARLVSLPTVHHLVTTVRGRLRGGVDLRALLRATFPGGSITGAPKIRAMEIIDELEPARRGPYTGATGWLGAAGDLDLAVAIRTAAIREGALTLWVGGGIVADSVPEDELRETEIKARAFARLAS